LDGSTIKENIKEKWKEEEKEMELLGGGKR